MFYYHSISALLLHIVLHSVSFFLPLGASQSKPNKRLEQCGIMGAAVIVKHPLLLVKIWCDSGTNVLLNQVPRLPYSYSHSLSLQEAKVTWPNETLHYLEDNHGFLWILILFLLILIFQHDFTVCVIPYVSHKSAASSRAGNQIINRFSLEIWLQRLFFPNSFSRIGIKDIENWTFITLIICLYLWFVIS